MELEPITASSQAIVDRFLSACTGWVRYKPLLTYITKPEAYESEIEQMRRTLSGILPKLDQHFQCSGFGAILNELEEYHKNVKKHYSQYRLAQKTWEKLIDTIEKQR